MPIFFKDIFFNYKIRFINILKQDPVLNNQTILDFRQAIAIKNRIIMRKTPLFLVIMLGLSNLIAAQNNFVLHNFDAVPQNYLTNPAIKNSSRFVIGFPALSSVHVGLNNSTNFSKLFKENNPFSNSYEFNSSDLTSVLGDRNRINVNIQEDILFAGFRIPKGFLSFGVSAQVDAGVGIDKELAELFSYGSNEPGFMNKTIDLSEMDIDITSYLQYHIGLSVDATEKLTIGSRFKYLVGLATLSFETFNATINTQFLNNELSSIIDADFLVNASFYGAPDILDSINMDNFDLRDALFGSKNKGMAFDFGAQYSLNDRIQLSASLIDLGFISWKTNVATYTYNLDEVDLGGFDGFDSDDDRFQEVIDSLSSKFNFIELNNHFRTTLATKYYLSASYKLDAKSWVDLLFYGRSRNSNLQTAVSVGINRQFGDILGLKANYSIIQRSFANLGLGVSFKLGPMQLYLLSDNILPAIDYRTNHRMTNFRFGLNFNIWKQKPKLVEIEPEVVPEEELLL